MELFAYAVDGGWIGEDSVVNSDIGEVSISDDDAKAVFINNGQKTTFRYRFVREDGQWKLDLTAIMPVSDKAFEQIVESSGFDENEYILLALEAVSGEKPSDDIWQPLVNE